MTKKGRTATTAARIRKGQKRFLEQLRECGVVGTAAARACIGRTTVYEWRDADVKFSQMWDETLELAYDDLEATIIERAKKGSDTLAIFIAKARWPEKYRENYDARQLENHPEIKRIALGFAQIVRRYVPKEHLREAIIEFFGITGADISSLDAGLARLLLGPGSSRIPETPDQGNNSRPVFEL